MRGARFTIYGNCRPTNSSGFFHCAMPETMVRCPTSSPKSTVHLMSLSVSGTSSAATTVPMRMSSFAKSSYVISGMPLAYHLVCRCRHKVEELSYCVCDILIFNDNCHGIFQRKRKNPDFVVVCVDF